MTRQASEDNTPINQEHKQEGHCSVKKTWPKASSKDDKASIGRQYCHPANTQARGTLIIKKDLAEGQLQR